MKLNENILFLRSFIHCPKRVGSIIPSSRFLAKKMVEQAPWHEMSAVAELGSGTGAITHSIHEHVSESAKVVLFEMNDTMRNDLQLKYPEYACYPDAANLVNILKQEHIQQLDCIFSGLPFFNFEREFRDMLVEQIYNGLKPGGLFIAFQYSLQMKKQLSEKFMIEKIDFVPWNVPPAFVYVCRKKEINRMETL
ncbi:class I SAM-dependent methyltransferase [Paenibacillus xylanilyticus]|uniref:Methyltransferase domain-containing protein n=1 Tax=Paenibacillus xylanilyticus TaxID=248903 RepID=A0A7Y6EXZ0_9BACL|nr:methyltransferase domain-containing protein [Paenibacillus xylanilyticus]NUU79361.1 methyltransferase domain-containing protein [Paenibacillus xylanilyticus]